MTTTGAITLDPSSQQFTFAQAPLDFLTWAAGHGDIVRFAIAGQPTVFINHPDLIHAVLVDNAASFTRTEYTRQSLGAFMGNGLLASDGAWHDRQRKLMQPAFHHKRLEDYTATAAAHASAFFGKWRAGQSYEFLAEMQSLTLQIITDALFGADVTGAIDAMHAVMEDLTISQASEFVGGDPGAGDAAHAITEVNKLIDALIEDRRQSTRAGGAVRGDLLAMLVSAVDDQGQPMTNAQIRDEVMTLFIAGHETTSVTLSWAVVLLAEHPQAFAELKSEIASVLRGQPPTVADLPNLLFTQMILREVLRLYPTAWILFSRAVSKPLSIGGEPVTPGDQVMISPYVIQRDSRFWGDPARFNPHRFEKGWEAGPPRLAYLPFGGGPRICIGQHLALMEMTLILATLAQRFRWTVVPDHPVIPDPATTLRPRQGVTIQLGPI